MALKCRFSTHFLAPLFFACMFFAQSQSCNAQTITAVSMLTDSDQTQSYPHVLNITGADFLKLGAAGTSVPVYVVPSQDIPLPTGQILSDTLIEARFTAGTDYELQSVVVAATGKQPLSFAVPEITCTQNDIDAHYDVVPVSEVQNILGNGLAANYLTIQLSIVSRCKQKIVIPLAGVTVFPRWHKDASKKAKDGSLIYQSGPETIAPTGLDHVMSVYNTDRTLTGSRAVFFNLLQGATTIGSAVERFLAPGFSEGVGIAGGAFRNAALEVAKDMSPQQLKSLASETFQDSETIGANGSAPVQKFIFVPRKDANLGSGKKQRIDDLCGIKLTWYTASNATQVENAKTITSTSQ